MSKQLSKLGLAQLANNKRILANWVTEEELTGKNIHSVYTLCFKCHSWGVNRPHNHNCGNCNSTDTIIYYDIDTVTKYVKESLDEAKGKLDNYNNERNPTYSIYKPLRSSEISDDEGLC